MQKTIIEEVHEWASKQAIKPPITKEFVGEIIERGNQAILREYMMLHKKYRNLEQNAAILADMLTEDFECEERAVKNVH